jgi:hypothetical protein
MKDSNKLIAEFMGQWNVHDTNGYWECSNCGEQWSAIIGENELPQIHSECLPDLIIHAKYHTEWNWLMPVVEEIHTHGCKVVISSNGVTTIYAPSGEVLAEESSEEENHMHDATYKAIVKVLKENLHKPCE